MIHTACILMVANEVNYFIVYYIVLLCMHVEEQNTCRRRNRMWPRRYCVLFCEEIGDGFHQDS